MTQSQETQTTVPNFILQKLALQGLEIDDLKFQAAYAKAEVAEMKAALDALGKERSDLQTKCSLQEAKLAELTIDRSPSV